MKKLDNRKFIISIYMIFYQKKIINLKSELQFGTNYFFTIHNSDIII